AEAGVHRGCLKEVRTRDHALVAARIQVVQHVFEIDRERQVVRMLGTVAAHHTARAAPSTHTAAGRTATRSSPWPTHAGTTSAARKPHHPGGWHPRHPLIPLLSLLRHAAEAERPVQTHIHRNQPRHCQIVPRNQIAGISDAICRRESAERRAYLVAASY